MDQMPSKDRELDIDLESGGTTYEEMGNKDPGLGDKAAKESDSSCNASNLSGISMETVKLLIDKRVKGNVSPYRAENKSQKERRKTTSGKKPPRPPRPPKALSLDAADQKLIKEISELAMVKRARIERMKALKRMKAEKASISTGNLFAMMFTILFCLVIICQGMCPGRSLPVNFQGSPELAQAADSGFISVHYNRNTSASDTSTSGSGSPSSGDKLRRAAESNGTNMGTKSS